MQACKFVGLMIPLCAAMDPSPRMGWLKHMQADRHRVNPFVGQPEAIAAGGPVFEDHCATCHRPNVTERMPRARETARLAKRSRAPCHRRKNLLAIAKRQLAEGYAHLGGVARADALADNPLHQEPGVCHARRCSCAAASKPN